MSEPDHQLPPWAISGLLWLCLALFGIVSTAFRWIFGGLHRRMKDLETAQKKMATSASVTALEMRVAPLVSRSELLAYMKQMRDDSDERFTQLTADRKSMHEQNSERIDNVNANVSEASSNIRALSARIDRILEMKAK